MRERFDEEVFLIGFATHSGEVTAASNGKFQPKEKWFVPHRKEVMKRSSI
jgi:erythromycin esterase-like protein